MRQIYTEKLNELKEKEGKSFVAIASETGISDSTLCRWFQGKGTPSIDDLERVFECLGASMESLFAEVGRSEMVDAEKGDYKGTNALLEEFSRREKIYRESCDQQIQHQIELCNGLQASFDHAIDVLTATHNAALEKRDQTYDRSIAHLKHQIEQVQETLRGTLAEKDRVILAEKEHMESYHKGRDVWRNLALGLLVAVFVLVACIIWEFANPHMGMTGVLLRLLEQDML